MRSTLALPLALAGLAAAAAAHPARAQHTRIFSTPAPQLRALQLAREDQPGAALGLSTGGAANARDTLGLLVTTIVPNGPADKAGIEEGNRLASINGVSLKVAPADTGDWELAGAINRRLTRELGKVKPGDEVELRVYSGGQTRTVHVRTADADSLYQRRRAGRSSLDERASLGIGIAMTGSRRDTLGVFVMSVDDSGPAARAGIEEGNRIASINGVDLRVAKEDAGDDALASTKVRRLQREVAKLDPGDDAELRVYANGQFRTVHVKAVRQSDLPRRRGGVFITGDVGGMIMPPIAPIAPLRLDGARISDDVRRALEDAMQGAGRAFDGLRGLPGAIYWHDDLDGADVAPAPEPGPVIRGTTPAATRAAAATVRSAALSASDSWSPLPAIADGGPRAMPAPAYAYGYAFGDATADAGALDLSGLRVVPVGAELATYLGLGSERGLLVLDVPDWAGALHPGDVILRVDGRAVRGGARGDDVNLAFDGSRDARVELLRAGELTTAIVPARR